MPIRSATSDIGQGFSNLASIFAPPSPQEIVASSTLAQNAAKLKQTQDAVDRIRSAGGAPSVADLYVVNPSGAAGDFTKLSTFREAQTGADLPRIDTLRYAGGASAGDTFTGLLAKPMSANEVQHLPPAFADKYGVPADRYGVMQTGKDQTTTVPGAGGVLVAPKTDAPENDDSVATTSGKDPVAAAAVKSSGGASPLPGGGMTITGKSDPADRPLTKDERRAFGIKDDDAAAMTKDGPKILGRGGVTVNNVGPNAVTKNQADEVQKSSEVARGLPSVVTSVQSALSQLNAPGGMITGFGADPRLSLQKLGAALGVADPNSIVNTETFKTQVKPLVLETVKGLGSGSGISNADRDFALQAVGGDVNLDPGTLRRVLDITQRAAIAKIKSHNDLVDRWSKGSPDIPQGQVDFYKVQPPGAAPSDPATGRPFNEPRMGADNPVAGAPGPYAPQGPGVSGNAVLKAPRNLQAGGSGAPVKVTSPEEAMRLPPGTPIELPDGTHGIVPGGR